MSRLVGAEAIGYAAVAVSLATLATSIAALNINVGGLRYVGEALGRGDLERASSYFWSGLSYLAFTYAAASAVLYLAPLGVSRELALATAALVLSNVSIMADVYIIAAYRAVVRFVGVFLGNAVRFAVGILFAGWGWVGAVAGNIAASVTYALLALSYSIRRLGIARPGFGGWLDMARAGVSTWAPSAVVIIAQQSGVLAVFFSTGAVGSGHLFVAQGIVGVVGALAYVVFNMLTPTLAAMSTGRRETATYAARIGLALTAPASVGLAVAPHVPLLLLGPDFADAATPLSLLALAVLPNVLNYTALSFLIAEGRFLHALYLSSVSSGVTLALYVVLTPQWGAAGAAAAMLIASIVTSLAASLYLKPGGAHLKAIALPLAVGAAVYWMPWPLALAAVGATYLLYPRAGVLTRRDVALLAEAILGKKAHTIYRRYHTLINTILPP
ncbi:MAG: polysaccharide biosynthesis C-terminal domain-containing protein [Pyrobaculum sp.]